MKMPQWLKIFPTAEELAQQEIDLVIKSAEALRAKAAHHEKMSRVYKEGYERVAVHPELRKLRAA